MTLIWQAIKAAFLPIALRDVPALLGRFLEHLQRRSDGNRERRAILFKRHIEGVLG